MAKIVIINNYTSNIEALTLFLKIMTGSNGGMN